MTGHEASLERDLLDRAAKAAAASSPAAYVSPPKTLWAFFVRAWRPAAGWAVAAILARLVIVPLVQLARGAPVEPIDGGSLTALAAIAGTLFVTRTFERSQGIA